MTLNVTAILVGYDAPPDGLVEVVQSLRRQELPPTRILCADQSPDGRFARFFSNDPEVDVVAIPENIGYPSACNRLAAMTEADYLLFVNPDAQVDADCVTELAQVLQERRDVAIAGAQVLLPDRRSVNAGDNALHLSGLSWSGRYGLPAEDGPPRPAAVASGAAMLVRRIAFAELEGYTEGFFMYYDDVDLAWRARLAGWEVMFCPRARVIHDYEFTKGNYKWRYLERNRWWCLLAHLELRTLIALAPLLAVVEVAVLLRAATGGWLPAKLGAWRLLWSDRDALRFRRRQIQTSRRISDRRIVERMTASVDSPFLASPLLRSLVPLLKAYRAAVLSILR